MRKRLTNEQFEKRAKSIHGDKYDYSLVEYKTTKQKVKIICKLHGVFEQVPNKHLLGRGCQKCGKSLKLNNSDFIERSKLIHNNKYDYSITQYKNARTKVRIICSIHGVFQQYSHSHLKGHGCYKCSVSYIRSKNCINPTGWSVNKWDETSIKSKNFDSFKVYIIRCWNENEEFYKIGRTFKSVKNRFRSKILMPYNYEIVNEYIFETAKEAHNKETELKRLHKELKYIPNIFFSGMHECFTVIKV